jgi:YVTN family beta-propeller protein
MRLRTASCCVLACVWAGHLWAQTAPSPALLVLSKGDHSLAIVDPSTMKAVGHVPSGPDPHEVIASSDGQLAFISNYGAESHTITVANLQTQTVQQVIDIFPLHAAHGLFFAGGELYFTAEMSKVIGRYSLADQKIDWILGTGQNRTHMIRVSLDLNHIYTANVDSGTITIIDKVNGVAGGLGAPPPPGAPRGLGQPTARKEDWQETLIPTGRGTEGFDISPDGKELWAAAADKGTIAIIDLSTKQKVQDLDADVPWANRLKFTPDGKYVFVSILSDQHGGNLAIFDAHTHKLVKRMKVGQYSEGILMQPDGSHAYLACTPDNDVAVIDLKTLEVVGHIDAGKGPDGMAWVAAH